MEIVFVGTEKRSNFDYINKLFKGKKVLNGFNKLDETMMFEPLLGNEFEVQNIKFQNEIEADLFISYPLKVVAKETIKFSTLHELITEIRKAYQTIYKEEIDSMVNLKESKNLYNRGTSNGKYGIWGHDIYDLCIEAIRIVEGVNKPMIEVAIGS